MVFQIKVYGVLDQSWSNWLGNVDICTEPAADGGVLTILSVDLLDQAALFGILDHIRDLNLQLVAVNQQAEGQADLWATSC